MMKEACVHGVRYGITPTVRYFAVMAACTRHAPVVRSSHLWHNVLSYSAPAIDRIILK
jgi:hypothetical protein